MPITNNVILANSSGSVGIGTYSPTVKLDVSGSAKFTVGVNGTVDITDSGAITLRNQIGAEGRFGTFSNHDLVLTTNNTSRLTIAAAGNVGINTTSPTLATLQVQGNVWAQSFTGSFSGSIANISGTTNYIPKFTNASTLGNSLVYDNGTTVIIGSITSISNPVIGAGQLQIQNSTYGSFNIYGTANTVDGSYIGLWKSRAGAIVNNADELGGIFFGGYDSANYRAAANIMAVVDGGPAASDMPGALLFKTTTDGSNSPSEKMRLTNAGNLGIGSTTVPSKLYVELSGAANQRLANFRNTGGNSFIEIQSSGTGAIGFWTAADNSFSIYQNSTAGTIGTSVLYVSSSTNVGIGTTAPGAKLTVRGGNIDVQESGYGLVTNELKLADYNTGIFTDGTNGNMTFSTYGGGTGNTFRWVTNVAGTNPHPSGGTTRMVMDKGGNVGIGTTSPVTSLQVSSSAAEAFRITGGTVNGLYSTFFNGTIAPLFLGFGGTLSATATNNDGVIRYNASYNLIFTSDGTERMRLNANGNLGIGTVSPAYKLEVSGETNSIGGFRYNAVPVIFNSSTDVYANIRVLASYSTFNDGMYINYNSSGSTSAHLRFYANATNERMRIDAASGNVGIATTSPTLAKLQVQGNVWAESFTGSFSGSVSAPGSNTQVVYNSGGAFAASSNFVFDGTNVGIGTTTPASKLEIYSGSGDNYIYTTNGTAATFNGLMIRYNNTNYMGAIGNPSSGEFRIGGFNVSGYYTTIYSNNSETVRVTAGNVGIGTTSPGAKLEVYNGDIWLNAASSGVNPEIRFIDDSGIAVAGAKIRYGNNDGNLYIEHVYNEATSGIFFRNRTSGTTLNTLSLVNGNVGIGTTSPTEVLDVYKANNTSWAPRILARDAAYASFLGVYNGLPGVFAHNSALSAWATLYLNTVDPTSAGNSANVLIGGNVGIGTSSPNAKLQLADGGADWATSGTIGTTLGSMHLSPSNNTANYGNAITFGSRDSGPYTSAHAGIYVRSGGSFGTTMAFGTTDSYAAGAKVSMFINESGLVTIPRSHLLVTTGNVGIGTTTTSYNLDILSTTTGVIRVRGVGQGYTQASIILQTDASIDTPQARGLGIYAFNEGKDVNWYFGTPYREAYADSFVINRKANTAFDVAAADPLDAANFLIVNSTGNIGVNNVTPTEKIQVSGSIYIPYTVDAGFLGFSYSDNFVSAGVRVPHYGMRWGNPSDGSGNVEAFYSGYGGIRMYAAGVLKLKIDSGGNIGLGPSTGSAGTLELTTTTQGSPVSGRLSFGTDGTGWQFRIAKNQGGTKTDYFTIQDDGAIGIGTTSPQTKLQIVNNVSGGGFASYGSYQILLYQAGSAANSYGIGIESNTMMFNSDNYYKFYVDNVAKVYIDNTGTITAAGDLIAYGSPSDITLKTNVKPLEGALEKITKLQGVSFTWKDSEQTKMTGLKDDIGFIAQEVKEILPELVRQNDNGLLSLRDKGIVPYLVEAIKEQQKQIDELRYLLQKK